MEDRSRFEEFARLATEQRNPRTRDLDTLDVPGILERIAAEDRTVPDAVARAGLKSPCLTIVGEVVRLHDELAWFGGRQASTPAATIRSTLTA